MRVEGGTLLLDTCASTMDEARRLVQAGETGTAAVRTRCQERGRGRRGAQWHAPAGTCLLVTYIVRDAAADDARGLGMRAGVAVAQAVSAVTGLDPKVKWPNDVLLGGHKVAGVLAETVGGTGIALVGVGLNVNVARFPAPLASAATSLLRATGEEWSVDALAEALRLEMRRAVAAPWRRVLAAWRSRDTTPGRRYVAQDSSDPVEGEAEGVADDGALLLRTGDGAARAVWSAHAVPVRGGP